VGSAPLEHGRFLPWQRVVLALCGGGPWDSAWGPAPSQPARRVCVVCANRVGKSEGVGIVIASHVTGRMPRWQRKGEVWGGMPTLQKSVEVQRPKIEGWLGTNSKPRWTPKEANAPAESFLRTAAGWKYRGKAFEQDRSHWYGGRCQLIGLDEPPPDEIVSEARTRLIDEAGVLLAVFTPLEGTSSALHRDLYEPWQDYRAKHATPGERCPVCDADEGGPFWGEVRPGDWVVSAGTRENAQSRGGFLPDAEIDAKEEELIRMGRPLEARVAIHGEWIEISEDRLIPDLATYTRLPHGGIAHEVAWLDSAVKANKVNCRSSIAVAGKGQDGKGYLLESHGGWWSPDERERIVLDVLKRHGDLDCFIQRTSTDEPIAQGINAALRRAGRRPCLKVWPPTGVVPGKVARANRFATLVASPDGPLVFVREDHEFVISQARTFSASNADRMVCDDLDAAMGALQMLFETDAIGDADMWRKSAAPIAKDGDARKDEQRTATGTRRPLWSTDYDTGTTGGSGGFD
jgi:phage terminase large subunit-like protein